MIFGSTMRAHTAFRHIYKLVKFLLEVGSVYYITFFYLIPLFLELPSLIYKFWQEVPLVSKAPIISYAAVIWLAITMLMFFVWLLKELYQIIVLRRTGAYGSILIGITMFPGLIFLLYFCAFMLLKK